MADEHKHEGEYDYAGTGYKYGSCRRLSWGAIFGGLFVTLAVFLVLQLLGAGIGISTLDIQDRGDNPETSTLGIGAGIWWFICTMISLSVGGWVSGYLANFPERLASALHGLVLWGLTYMVMFWLTTTVLAAMIGGTIGLIGEGISTPGQTAPSRQIQQALQGIGKTTQEADGMNMGMDPKEQQARAIAQEKGQKAVKITGGSLIGLAVVMLIGAVVAIFGAIAGSCKCCGRSHGDATHRHDRAVMV